MKPILFNTEMVRAILRAAGFDARECHTNDFYN